MSNGINANHTNYNNFMFNFRNETTEKFVKEESSIKRCTLAYEFILDNKELQNIQ